MLDAAHELGTENLLTIAGSTYIPWLPDREPVPIGVCAQRAHESIGKLLPKAEKLGVSLNIENIVFNGYLTTPDEMNAFVDSFASKHVRVHFDTGNVMLFQFPEHWIPILGGRIRNVHFKEFSKKGTDHTLESFRTLLDGTTNWPAVMDALETAGYEGYVTFEYFHPFLHYPEALVEQSSDALDRILGRKLAQSCRLMNRSGRFFPGRDLLEQPREKQLDGRRIGELVAHSVGASWPTLIVTPSGRLAKASSSVRSSPTKNTSR